MGKISDDDDGLDTSVPRSTWSDLSVWIFLAGAASGGVFGFLVGAWLF